MKGLTKLLIISCFLQLLTSVSAQTLIKDWGSIGSTNSWDILNDSTTSAGDAYISGSLPMKNWASLVGAIEEPIAITSEGLLITGKLNIIGDDLDYWNPFRFGVFYFDSLGSLENQFTDSASWSGSETNAHGYLFTPQSGSHGAISGQGGDGNQWAINGGSWMSTWSSGTTSLGQLYQSPKNAVITEGSYEFEMSVQPLADGTTEIRWYMIDESYEHYLIVGQTIDTTDTLSHLNAFAFGLNQSIPDTNTIREIQLTDIKFETGIVEIPSDPGPRSPHYIDSWAFINNHFGTNIWTLTRGNLVGNVTFSGALGTTPVVVAGEFGLEYKPTLEEGFILNGEITFYGGEFEEPENFSLGLFHTSNTQIDSTQEHGYVFSDINESHKGYLITPGNGSVFSISDSSWHTLSSESEFKIGAGDFEGVPSAGTYQFEFGAQTANNGMLVRFSMVKNDKTFSSSAYLIDTTQNITESFNIISFGISNPTTNQISIEALLLNYQNIVSVNESIAEIPTQSYLHQNYPNPFNPETVIRYQLPIKSVVSMKVFDVLGREVATLVNGVKAAGEHSVNFDASGLSSGIYMYQLQTEHFVNTKRMLLVK